jgi:methylenetetrahydrofolate reductase (NADPH)
MKIKNILREKREWPSLSFEIFPPKPNSPFDILQIANECAKLSPDFMSVTYGAGGSTHDKTIEIASMIKQRHGIETIAHLTCISFTKDQINATAQELVKNNIENVLALRGDLPNDPNFIFPNPLHFEHANDLVTFLNSKFDFCLGGAYYPEGHTESKSMEEDLHFTIKKIESGVEYLISQAFFDNKYYYQSRAKIRDSGFQIPLIAGIMPVMTRSQIERIIKLSGCDVPERLQSLLNKFANDPKGLLEAGLEYTADQIKDLMNNNVDGIHIFTMNNPIALKTLLSKLPFRAISHKALSF